MPKIKRACVCVLWGCIGEMKSVAGCITPTTIAGQKEPAFLTNLQVFEKP